MKKDELIKRLYTHKIIGDKDLMQILEEAGFKDYAISSIINKIADITNAPLPPAEGAEAIVKKYEDEYDFKFHWVQRDRVIRMMREFAAQPQPKLDPKKVQWSGYGELGNISQKPLQPTAEGAEANRASIDDLIKKHIPIDAANFEYCAKHNIINGGLLQGIRDVVNSFMKPQPTAEGAEEILAKIPFVIKHNVKCYEHEDVIAAMQEFATLHAQRIAEKMVWEKLREELIRFDAWGYGSFTENKAIIDDVDEYLKSREK